MTQTKQPPINPERFIRLLIVLFEEAVDRGLQVGDGAKEAALEPALCEGREEALDGVEPGSRCRGEMKRPSRMAFEPSANIGMLMGGVIADDGVDRLSNGNLLLDDIEEANELLMAMALPVAADHPCRRECSSRRTQSSCRAVHNHASWFRRDLSSAAIRAGCGRAPESGSFRRPTGRWRVRADRHGARRHRAICRRSAGRWRVVGQLELAHPVRLQTARQLR